MSSEQSNVALFKKLIAIRKGIKSVKKSGYNSHGKYHYPTEQDFMDAVRDLLNEHNVLIFTSSEITDIRPSLRVKDGKEEHSGFITSVQTVHTFVDADTGASYSVTSVGQGHDTLGDKGSNKSITSAFKYLISKNFLIETNDDPEADSSKPSGSSRTYPPKAKSTAPSGSFSGTTTKPASKPVSNTSGGFGTKKLTPPASTKAAEVQKTTNIDDVDF